jgi:L-threonylcarbamoyladenylate synthase
VIFTAKDTVIIKVDPERPDVEALMPVANAAREGKPVVFPTDTVYGLGTNAFMPKAVLDVFRIKGRPVEKPLILLIADPEDVEKYVLEVRESARALIKQYWPGPLTLIFNKAPNIPSEVTAGGQTIGVRCPDNEVARTLIRMVGNALATTSANLAGQPSPKNAAEAQANLGGRVAYIVDGGPSKLGIASTVIDLSSGEPKLIREGSIRWGELKDKLGI